MKLADFSVKNSLLVNIVSVFILIAGFMAMKRIPLDAFPQVDFDIVIVSTSYPGASPEDVEKLVTIAIEKEIKGISGIKEMTSTSEEGMSSIGITIDPAYSDKDEVVQDIKDAVDRVRDLPEGVSEDPVVRELKSKERPVLEVSVLGDQPEQVIRQYAETLEDLILDIKGVASVKKYGWRDPEFWVEVDPQRMKDAHVSLDEIISALRRRNVTLPAGRLTTETMEYGVRISDEFVTPKEIEEVVIRANDAGNWLKVKDVAAVRDTFEDQITIAKVNGKPALAMVVVKSETGNIIDIVKKVHVVIEQFKKGLPDGMDVVTTNDFSYYVQRRLGVLQNNGLIGFLMVLLLLFLFLDKTSAFVTAMGVPVAIFMTFIAMYMMGITINLVSMLGLIIVLGMLVDDGIIVSENVYRYIEGGMRPKEAAVKGTQEVIAPVTGTILTTIAAFAPLLFMKDIIGKFIKEVPMVVMIALTASLLEAFIILPAHLSDFISWHKKHREVRKKAQHGEKPWFKKIQTIYLNSLHAFLNYRVLSVILMFLVFCFSIYIFKTKLRFEFFPNEGIEQFLIRVEAPQGTPLEKTNEFIKPLEELVAQLPSNELDAFRTYLGVMETEQGFDPNARSGSHLGQISVFLTAFQTRERTTQEIAEDIRAKFEGSPGFEKIYIYKPKAGPPVGRAIAVGIKGENFDTLNEIAARYVKRLKTIEGVTDLETSYDFGKKQMKVYVDREKASRFYLDVETVAESVRNAFKGGIATSIKPLKAEEEIDVVVRFKEDERGKKEAFEKILVPNRFGNLIPLESVAKVEEEDGFFKIDHLDGKRVVYVLADVDETKTNSLEVNTALREEFENVSKDYLGYIVKYTGEFEEQLESRQNLMSSFLISMCVIFIILTAMFRSLIQPFIVMVAIPFGIIGVILAFWIHGKAMGFFGMMGIVGLTGIVVNDSIVLVDFINRSRLEGKSRRESIVHAGLIRLRPVLMTSLTTIGGLISVAYGIGGGDPFLKPMALAIVWGLVFSTALTLVGIPCIYAIFDDVTEKILHRSLVKTVDK